MLIGIPKEIKDHEYRVGLTPAGAYALARIFHQDSDFGILLRARPRWYLVRWDGAQEVCAERIFGDTAPYPRCLWRAGDSTVQRSRCGCGESCGGLCEQLAQWMMAGEHQANPTGIA